MNYRLKELQEKLAEVDSLINEILNDEPEEARGTYGRIIYDMFEDLDWIDFCCGVDGE